MLRKTITLATKHELGVVKVLLPSQPHKSNSLVLIGSKVMKHKTQEKIILIVGSVILFVVLYYFVKAVVVLPN